MARIRAEKVRGDRFLGNKRDRVPVSMTRAPGLKDYKAVSKQLDIGSRCDLLPESPEMVISRDLPGEFSRTIEPVEPRSRRIRANP